MIPQFGFEGQFYRELVNSSMLSTVEELIVHSIKNDLLLHEIDDSSSFLFIFDTKENTNIQNPSLTSLFVGCICNIFIYSAIACSYPMSITQLTQSMNHLKCLRLWSKFIPFSFIFI